MNKVEQKNEQNLEKIFSICLKVFYYYYFVLAIINLILFYFKLYNILNVTTILMIVGIVIEFLCGTVRGFLGILGYIVSIGLSIYFLGNIWFGISIGLSIISIINIIINELIGKFLSFMIRKFN